MNMLPYFKSIIDQDRNAIVVCNLDHEIIYMNPAATKNYSKWGGSGLVGKNLLNCHNPNSRDMIKKVVEWFGESKKHNIIFTYHNIKHNKDVYMVALRDENGELIGYYEKHEYRNAETEQPYNFKCIK